MPALSVMASGILYYHEKAKECIHVYVHGDVNVDVLPQCRDACTAHVRPHHSLLL